MSRSALDAFVRDLGGLFAVRRIYPSGNEQVSRAAVKAAESLRRLGQGVRIARVGGGVVVEDRTLEEAPAGLRALLDRLAELGREGLHIDAEAGAEDFGAWIEAVVRGDLEAWGTRAIRAGALRFDDGEAPVARRAEAAAGYLSLLPEVRQSLADLAEEKAEGLARARQIVRAIAGQVAAGGTLIDPIRELRAHDDYTFTHALNVCVLSAALCRVLGAAQTLTDTVALAAFCHDIGKERIPPEILNKQGPLDAEERKLMDRHPIDGAAILLHLPEAVHPLLPVVAYQHHRGQDGSGYPPHPARLRTHPASLLVSVADVYDAIRTVRSYQGPLTGAGAFSVMLRLAREGALHAPYVGAFARLLRMLRPGDRVTLSDGSEATVAAGSARDPLRPAVEAADGRILRLEETPELWVEKVFDRPEDVDAVG